MSVSCDSCRALIQVPQEMPHMFISSDGLTRFRCMICQQGFQDSGHVAPPRQEKSNDSKLFKCTYCDKSYSSAHYLVVHSRTHTGQRPYVCEVCDKTFTSSSYLQIHQRRHTNTKPFKCKYCNRGFIQKSGLNNHVRCHTGERPYKCGVCGRRFPQLSSLRGHMNMHTEARPYKCDSCFRSFRHKRHLEGHLRVHEQGKTPVTRDLSVKPQWVKDKADGLTHQCFICYRKFHCDFNLKTHIEVYHREHVCHICSTFYLQKAELNAHLQHHQNDVSNSKTTINLVSDDSGDEKRSDISFSNGDSGSESVSDKGCQIDFSESRSNASDSSCEITRIEGGEYKSLSVTKQEKKCDRVQNNGDIPSNSLKETSQIENEVNTNVTQMKNEDSDVLKSTSSHCIKPEVKAISKPKMGPKSFLAKRKKMEEELAKNLKEASLEDKKSSKEKPKPQEVKRLKQKNRPQDKTEKITLVQSNKNVEIASKKSSIKSSSNKSLSATEISKSGKKRKEKARVDVVLCRKEDKRKSNMKSNASEIKTAESSASDSIDKKDKEDDDDDDKLKMDVQSYRKENKGKSSSKFNVSEMNTTESTLSDSIDKGEEKEEDDDDTPKRRKPRFKSLKWPCGLCQEECRNECVCCDGCDTWHHLKCIGLFGDEDELDEDDWYCDDCKDNKVDEEQKAEMLEESTSEESDSEAEGERTNGDESDTSNSSSSTTSSPKSGLDNSSEENNKENGKVLAPEKPDIKNTEQCMDNSSKVVQGRESESVEGKAIAMTDHGEYTKVEIMDVDDGSEHDTGKIDGSTKMESSNVTADVNHGKFVKIKKSVTKKNVTDSTVIDHSEYAKPDPEKIETEISPNRKRGNSPKVKAVQSQSEHANKTSYKKIRCTNNNEEKNGVRNPAKKINMQNSSANTETGVSKNRRKIIKNNSKIVNEHIDEILEYVACGKHGTCDNVTCEIIEEGVDISKEQNVIVQSTMSGLIDDGLLLNFDVIDGGDIVSEEVDNFVGVANSTAAIICAESCSSEEWYFRHGHDYF